MLPALAGAIGAVAALAVVALVLGIRRGLASRSMTPRVVGEAGTAWAPGVVEALPWGAMLVGPDDEVLAMNDAATTHELGRGTRVALPGLLQRVRAARRDRDAYRGPLGPDGDDDAPIVGAVVPLPDDHILVVADDLSEARRVQTMRTDFLTNVSHELKTPIGAISILAEAIEAAEDDPEAIAAFAARLRRESTRLGELVGQIITLSRLEATPRRARDLVDLGAVVDDALARCAVLAEARKVSVSWTRSRGLQVLGDREQLTDAVSNLLRNAIAYSDISARVAISLQSVTSDGAPWVELRVTDNGIGIRPEDQERVFERFFRVDYGRSREHGGTGLGLSIVAHIASIHGGTVTLWSVPKRGSTFTLRLPLVVGERPDMQEEVLS